MDLWISSYEKNIYKLKINKGCTKVKEIEEKKITCYPSYICKYGNKIAVALKKNDGEKTTGIIILNNKMENIFEFYNEVSYTHIYIDNKYILAGSYHEGEILIINQKNKNIDIKKYENSKIHNVGKLSKNKYYAVDLENAKIYIFKIIEGKYQEIETIKIDNNKPRHLIVNKKRIYVLCEDTSNILCYKEINKKYEKYQEINSVSNSKNNEAAAIKMKGKVLYTTNRGDNTINIYDICKNGYLNKNYYITSFGKNPRDILPINNNLICVINKDSNNLIFINIKNKKVNIINKVDIPNPVCVIK